MLLDLINSVRTHCLSPSKFVIYKLLLCFCNCVNCHQLRRERESDEPCSMQPGKLLSLLYQKLLLVTLRDTLRSYNFHCCFSCGGELLSGLTVWLLARVRDGWRKLLKWNLGRWLVRTTQKAGWTSAFAFIVDTALGTSWVLRTIEQ